MSVFKLLASHKNCPQLVKRCARSGHRTREDQILIFNAPDNQRTEGCVMRMREVRGRPVVGRT